MYLDLRLLKDLTAKKRKSDLRWSGTTVAYIVILFFGYFNYLNSIFLYKLHIFVNGNAWRSVWVLVGPKQMSLTTVLWM